MAAAFTTSFAVCFLPILPMTMERHMSSGDPVAARSELSALCERFASGDIDRRVFMRTAAQLGMAGAAAAVLPQLSGGAEAANLAQQTAATTARLPLDVAE